VGYPGYRHGDRNISVIDGNGGAVVDDATGQGIAASGVFVVMGFVYAACGLARLAILFNATQNWPEWLSSSVLVFLPLVVLSLFMFSSIPPLLEVLRASDEVQSLRGQAKFRAVVQAVPLAVVGTRWNWRAAKPAGSTYW
jgi:hypothetical protein